MQCMSGNSCDRDRVRWGLLRSSCRECGRWRGSSFFGGRSPTPSPSSSVRSSTHSSGPKIEDGGFFDVRPRRSKIEEGGFFDIRLRRSKMAILRSSASGLSNPKPNHTYHGRFGTERTAEWRGGVGQDWVPTELFDHETSLPRTLQSIEDTFPRLPRSTNKRNPM